MQAPQDLTPREQLKEIIKKDGIVLEETVLSSSRKSPYYYDIKKAILTARGLALAGSLGLGLVQALGAKSVGGLESGAIPFATSISMSSAQGTRPIDLFFVRKQAKQYGRRKWVEGNVDSPAVIVDDVVTTGRSSMDAADRVTEMGYTVKGIVAVVDREEGARELFSSRGLEFASMFSHSDDFKEYIEARLAGKTRQADHVPGGF